MLVWHSPAGGFSGEIAWQVLALLYIPSGVLVKKLWTRKEHFFDDVTIVISGHSINQSINLHLCL